MRLIETCSCGASLEVIYTAPNSEYSFGQKREEADAKANVAAFRETHKNHAIMAAVSNTDTREGT